MKICPRCGQEVHSDRRTCVSCGWPFDWKDPQVTDSVSQRSNSLLPNEGQTDELTNLSFEQRLSRFVVQHRGTSLAIAGISVVAVIVLAILFFTRSPKPTCYSTGVKYGDLARRVEYYRIPEIRNQANIEVEDDDLRHAAQVVIDFVATAKVLGGEGYITRNDVENFARNHCFANDL